MLLFELFQGSRVWWLYSLGPMRCFSKGSVMWHELWTTAWCHYYTILYEVHCASWTCCSYCMLHVLNNQFHQIHVTAHFSPIVQKRETSSVLKLNYILHVYLKNTAGKTVQSIKQRRDPTTVLWVPMKLLILSENIWEGYFTIKEDLILIRQFTWMARILSSCQEYIPLSPLTTPSML